MSHTKDDVSPACSTCSDDHHHTVCHSCHHDPCTCPHSHHTCSNCHSNPCRCVHHGHLGFHGHHGHDCHHGHHAHHGFHSPNHRIDCNTPVCLESHTSTVVKEKFVVEVCIEHSINMPACGEEVQVKISCVDTLGPDGIFFNSTVGFLHVVTYDPMTQIVSLRNLCETCNVKDPGELIAADTCFYVGPPTCTAATSGTGNVLQPFLAADLVVPEVGNCCLIKVTTVNGISVNAIISINTFQYRVAQVIDATTIEICNDGDGGTPGMLIEADANNDGVFDHPIIIVSLEDPCDKPSVTEGLIVVCDNGLRTTLKGSANGEIPVYDNDAGVFKLELVDFPALVCTTFVGCLTLIPTQPDQEYQITVTDVTGFQVGDVVFFNCDTEDPDREFILVDITASVFTLRATFAVPVIEVIADDCEGCKIVRKDCCARLDNIIECIKPLIVPTTIQRDSVLGVAASPPEDIPNADTFANDSTQQIWANNTGNLTAGDVVLSAIPSYTFMNTSPCAMLIDIFGILDFTLARFAINGGLDYQILLSTTGFATTDFAQVNPLVDVLAANSFSIRNGLGSAIAMDVQTLHVDINTDFMLAAGASVTVHYLGRILNITVGSSPSTVNNMPTKSKAVLFPECDASNCDGT